MNINQKIIDARKRKHLTQEELGKLVGVTKSAVMKWEKGIVSNIKRSVIVKLSQVLDLSPLDILGIEPPADQQILDDFHSLNEEGQAKARAYIHDLARIPEYKKPSHLDSEAAS